MKRLVPEPLDASSFDDSGNDDSATEVQPVAPWAPRMLPSVITVASAPIEQPDAQTPPRTILPVPP